MALRNACRKSYSTHTNTLSPAFSSSKLDSALKYCQESVRKQDYENYLCIPFYPRHLQPAQYALRAFNAEIASVRESVSDPIIGKMRMQFWRNTIDQAFAKKPPQQPIAIALTSALETCSLSSLWFKRIITERESNLEDPQYMTIKDMETYAENTASTLLYLQLESLGVRDVSADHAASHLGKAIGIATLLRALPFHASRRRLVLPAQVTAKHKVSQEEVFRTGHASGLEDAIFEVATAAHDHMLTARSLADKIPTIAMPVMLAAVPCNGYLKRLEAYNFNAFEPKVQIRDWKLPLQLWSSYRKSKF